MRVEIQPGFSVPSALSDLTIVSVEANPQVPAYDRQAEIICTVKTWLCKSRGRVDFYIENQENGVKLEALLLK